MKEVDEFLRNCGVFYLATIDENKPRVRPFGITNIFDNKLYVLTGKKKDVFKQIQKNQNVEISANIGERWIRIEGKLINDDNQEAKKSILDNNPQLRAMYSEDDDNTAVLYFENAKATFYSFTEEPKTVEF
jgi:uncharacterized pyridoxamine 5'-phosphate oxidase family protein